MSDLRTALIYTLRELVNEHGHGFDSDAGWPSCRHVHPVMKTARAALAASREERPGLDVDPWQWLHDNEFSWDDVNAIAAILNAGGFDICRAALSDTPEAET